MTEDPTPFGHFGSPFQIGIGLINQATGEEGTIVSDQPQRVWRGRASKQDMEWAHLGKFNEDLANSGYSRLVNIARGADPPDFTVYENGRGPIGVEGAALIVERRRRCFHLFRELRARLLARPPQVDFSRMRGCVIGIHFKDDQPPKRTDSRTLDKIIHLLADFDPPIQRIRANPHVAYWPRTGDDVTLLVEHYWGEQLKSHFAAQLGFELVPHWNVPIWDNEVMTALQETIAQHDKPGVDVLLVTTSAPDRDGWQWPSDNVAFDIVTRNASQIPPPRNIQAITLHDYLSGKIFKVWPQRARALEGPDAPLLDTRVD